MFGSACAAIVDRGGFGLRFSPLGSASVLRRSAPSHSEGSKMTPSQNFVADRAEHPVDVVERLAALERLGF